MSISVAQSRNLETKVQTPQQGLEATATTGSLKALISEANILRLPAAWFLRGFSLSRANSDCGAATRTCSPRHLGTWALHGGHGLEKPGKPNSQPPWPPISRSSETSWPLAFQNTGNLTILRKSPAREGASPEVHLGELPPRSGQYFANILTNGTESLSF